MFIQNPPFLTQQPRPSVQLAILLTLLWAALPLGLGLPAGIMLLFCVLLAVRFLLVQMQVGKIALPVIVLLMVASVLLVWQQLGTIIGRDGGISLLLLMIMLKSYEGSSRRDWQVLLLAMLFFNRLQRIARPKPANRFVGVARPVGGVPVFCHVGWAAGSPSLWPQFKRAAADFAVDGGAVCGGAA